MLREYRRQHQRLELMHRYQAVVTHSQYMHAEYLKHGLDPQRIHSFSYFAHHDGNGLPYHDGLPQCQDSTFASAITTPPSNTDTRTSERHHYHLLFLSRMSLLKGGHVLLEALPQVTASLGKPLRVTFAGDGPERRQWERQASQVQAREPALWIEFTGWVGRLRRDELLADCDLLVVPSLWPEPFGLVGLEVGSYGVPTAGFAVGGIPEWLFDGINGCIAPSDPPTAAGLAEAISRCLRDPFIHARLRRGAVEIAQEFQLQHHLDALVKVFEEIVRNRQLAYA
jgi:glycosyltransferase involved in cell wall biosynthesis